MLQAIFSSSALEASQYISLIWVAVALGAVALGYLSKHISKNTLIRLSACIGLISGLTLLLMPHLIPSLLILCMLGIGFSGSSMIFTYALITANNPPNVHGTLIGFTNMMVILPGTTLLPLCGLFLKHLPNHIAITSHYTINRYHLISAIIIACFSIALGLSQWIKRLYPSG
jgi:MFS family permease